MEVTLLGTGSPVPLLERAGTSVAVRANGQVVVVDCGPGTVYRLLDNGINPGDVEHLLFTHHHVDHNASFFHFAIAGWSVGGRGSLTVYGPPSTSRLLDALDDVYAEDIAYRKHVGYPAAGIDDIEFVPTTGGLDATVAGCRVRACPVEHSIETYAYRFDDRDTGASVVISGDTRKLSALSEFAAGADVLIHDACIGPVADAPPEGEFVWSAFAQPMDEGKRSRLAAVHADAREVGEVAAAAGVETVVLTHLLPYRDTSAMCEQAASVFDGDVVVGEDGLTIAL